MAVSRSVDRVGGGELSSPVGFGVEECFSAGGESVAELQKGVDELLHAFSGRLGCACSFTAVSCGELLGGVEVTETSRICEVIGPRSGRVQLHQHDFTNSQDLGYDMRFKPGEVWHVIPYLFPMNGSSEITSSSMREHHSL